MSELAGHHAFSADVVDRILRRRVSQEALAKVVRLMGSAFEGYLNARFKPITPDLLFRFVTDGRVPKQKPGKDKAKCAAFAFDYESQRALVCMMLDRSGFNIVSAALLGGDPEMEVNAFDGNISSLELNLFETLTDAVARSRKSDGPLMAFSKVAMVRGDDAALDAGEQGALATLTFEMTFGVNRALCALEVPHKLLLELAAQLTELEVNAERRRMPDRFNVPDFHLDIEVVLPLAAMTLQTLAVLRPGMVLEAAPTGGKAIMRARGRDLFHTDIGRMGQMHATQVTAPFGAITAALKAHAEQHTPKEEG